ncbi:MAG: hypothetical protein E6507_09775 [Prevotella bivia]|nr:hypothetical protein [Prevotella bivia]
MKLKGLFIGLFLLSLTACTNHPSYKNADEAINAGRDFLSGLHSKENASIRDLKKITNEWIQLRDSSYSAFARDTSITLRNPIAQAFFILSDSVRKEVKRLAFSQPRSLNDVMEYKLATSPETEIVQKSQTYKEAKDFFDSLDDVPTYISGAKTIHEYESFLANVKKLKTEADFINFIKDEDKCYRSLMLHLSEIPQQEMQLLTTKTSEILSNLYDIIGKKSDAINDRVMLYLTMRFNRRIVQNMVACKEDILNEKPLSVAQKNNYRWMLIQAFTNLDTYSIACLDKKQNKLLLEITESLPELLNRITVKKAQQEDDKKLSSILAQYFLKTQLNSIL